MSAHVLLQIGVAAFTALRGVQRCATANRALEAGFHASHVVLPGVTTGGVAGGASVRLAAPVLFPGTWEYPLGLWLVAALALLIFHRDRGSPLHVATPWPARDHVVWSPWPSARMSPVPRGPRCRRDLRCVALRYAGGRRPPGAHVARLGILAAAAALGGGHGAAPRCGHHQRGGGRPDRRRDRASRRSPGSRSRKPSSTCGTPRDRARRGKLTDGDADERGLQLRLVRLPTACSTRRRTAPEPVVLRARYRSRTSRSSIIRVARPVSAWAWSISAWARSRRMRSRDIPLLRDQSGGDPPVRAAGGAGSRTSVTARRGSEIAVGDARLCALEVELARGAAQHFDVLAIDAFSSDSVPMHSLTREAVDVYLQHLDPGGILALHISNRYLHWSLGAGDRAPLRAGVRLFVSTGNVG